MRLTETKLYELIKTILEQEFTKKSDDVPEDEVDKGASLNIDIEENPFKEDE